MEGEGNDLKKRKSINSSMQWDRGGPPRVEGECLEGKENRPISWGRSAMGFSSWERVRHHGQQERGEAFQEK